jgi:phospholipid/cholesterol/gamma-HCH transport system substrate-binding protein
METRGHHIVVGIFVVTMLIGIFVSIVWLAQLQFRREGQIYDIYFTGSVSGLSEGAPVRYKGVPIGRVLSIRLDRENVERIRVRIEVDSGTPIKEDAVASLELQGITGQAFVQISGGSNSSPVVRVPPGKSYPVIASRPSRLEEVVANAPELLNRVIKLTDRLTVLLSDANVSALSQTLSNLETVTATVAKRSGDFDRMIGDAGAAMAALNDAAASADATIGRVGKILNDKDGVGDKLAVTLDDFDKSAKSLAQMTGRLDGILQDSRGGFRDFSQRGLAEAAQLMVDARALVAELNRIAGQFERDPARFLLGDRREGYRPR